MSSRASRKRKSDANTSRGSFQDDYEPKFFLRCHSEDNEPSDNDTKVWKCAFEPSLDGPGETTNTVAACGGKIVALIDCHSGRLLRRFKDKNPEESFYTLAWTTLKGQGGRGPCNVLAVAGEGAAVKLIHPEQLVVYATLKSHRKYISCLRFHPTLPSFLFSGSQDGRVILWNIGYPDLSKHSTDFSPLLRLLLPDTDALNLVYSSGSEMLVAACEDGCFAWPLAKTLQKAAMAPTAADISANLQLNLPSKPGVSDTVDDIVLVSQKADIVASKQVGAGTICLWRISDHVPQELRRKQLTKVKVTPLVQLFYTQLQVDYLSMGFSSGMLTVGDDQGSVYIYDLNQFLQKPKSSKDVIGAAQVLEWPALKGDSQLELEGDSDSEEVVMNCVVSSGDNSYIVCGTDNNLVCIWQLVSS